MEGPVPSSWFKVQGWEAGSQGAALALFPIPHSAFQTGGAFDPQLHPADGPDPAESDRIRPNPTSERNGERENEFKVQRPEFKFGEWGAKARCFRSSPFDTRHSTFDLSNIPHSALRTPHFKRAPLPSPLPAPSSRGEGIRGSREGRPGAQADTWGGVLLPRPATKERGEGFVCSSDRSGHRTRSDRIRPNPTSERNGEWRARKGRERPFAGSAWSG